MNYPPLTKRPTRLQTIVTVVLEALGGIVACAVFAAFWYALAILLDT